MRKFVTIISASIFTIIIIVDSYAQLTGGWTEQQNPSGYNLNDVKFLDENTGVITGRNGLILKTTNSGNNWIQINSGTTKNLNSISKIFSSIIYIAGDSGIILKSIDTGNSWSQLNSQTQYHLNTVVFKSSDTGFVAGNKGKLLKTTNSGLTWISTFTDTSASFYSLSYINDNFIWVVGQKSHPKFPVGNPIMINTSDFGSSWNSHDIKDFYRGTSIYFVDTLLGFAFNCSTPLNFGILRTINGGVDWECMYGLFNSPDKVYFINQFTGFSIGDGHSNDALYISTNSGQNWYTSYIPYIYLILKSVYFINPQTGWIVGNKIFKTTNGGGLITNLASTSQEIPSGFSLHQNYPNPFNPSTRISFHINVLSFIVLSVYNSEGRKIENLHEGNLNAGSYEITFDGSNYPSGVYYYKLESNGNSISKKMLLLK